jgi:hypothetical protein
MPRSLLWYPSAIYEEDPMSALVLAAALALAPAAAPAPCPAINAQQAATAAGVGPHPLSQEPPARRMHAVLRKVGGCAIVDVSVVRSGARVWEYQPVGPAIGRPIAASIGR